MVSSRASVLAEGAPVTVESPASVLRESRVIRDSPPTMPATIGNCGAGVSGSGSGEINAGAESAGTILGSEVEPTLESPVTGNSAPTGGGGVSQLLSHGAAPPVCLQLPKIKVFVAGS